MVSFSPFSNGDGLRSSQSNCGGAAGDTAFSLSEVAVTEPWTHAIAPLVSLVVPAFNEAALLAQNLARLCAYMKTLEPAYRWEIVVVNDGSIDDTAAVAEQFALGHPQVNVVHHLTNGGLGQALQTGARASRGRYVVTLDLDLSYAPEHVGTLLEHLRRTQARVVVASPYMPGGRVSHVPWGRRQLSLWANRFLARTAKGRVSTLTGLVRAYDGDFLRSLNLLSSGMEVNPEILHKAVLLHERIEEVPAHLCWSSEQPQRAERQSQRRSSMKIFRHTWSTFFFGFLFRPVIFFVLPSLVFLGLAGGIGLHALLVYLRNLRTLGADGLTLGTWGEALNVTFAELPHSVLLMSLALMLAIQLFGMGLLAVQNKRYFEEIFYLGMRAKQASPPCQDGSDDRPAPK